MIHRNYQLHVESEMKREGMTPAYMEIDYAGAGREDLDAWITITGGDPQNEHMYSALKLNRSEVEELHGILAELLDGKGEKPAPVVDLKAS